MKGGSEKEKDNVCWGMFIMWLFISHTFLLNSSSSSSNTNWYKSRMKREQKTEAVDMHTQERQKKVIVCLHYDVVPILAHSYLSLFPSTIPSSSWAFLLFTFFALLLLMVFFFFHFYTPNMFMQCLHNNKNLCAEKNLKWSRFQRG